MVKKDFEKRFFFFFGEKRFRKKIFFSFFAKKILKKESFFKIFFHSREKRITEKRLFCRPLVSQYDKVFFLGGSGKSSDQVTIFENETFGMFGQLRWGRIHHVAIPFGDDVLIIGGKLGDLNYRGEA